MNIVTKMEVVFRGLPIKCVNHQMFHNSLANTNISSDIVQLLNDVETTHIWSTYMLKAQKSPEKQGTQRQYLKMH